MKFHIHEGAGEFGDKCAAICSEYGFSRTEDPAEASFSVAPLLQKILPRGELEKPRLGTLIFHPSILPYHRGPDAIRWTMARGERVSGVTWFWADDGKDTGEICEQEPVLLDLRESPGRNYHTRFVPAGLRSLERAVRGIFLNAPRRIPQEEALASYEPRYHGDPLPHPPGTMQTGGSLS